MTSSYVIARHVVLSLFVSGPITSFDVWKLHSSRDSYVHTERHICTEKPLGRGRIPHHISHCLPETSPFTSEGVLQDFHPIITGRKIHSSQMNVIDPAYPVFAILAGALFVIKTESLISVA